MENLKRIAQHEVVVVEEEWIILNLEAYTVTTLNEVGSFCWTLLEEQMTRDEVLQGVAAEYQLETSKIEHDITCFLNELEKCGLVERVS